jgi:hypothetical protein
MFVAHARQKRNESDVGKALRQQTGFMRAGQVLAVPSFADVVHLGESLATETTTLAFVCPRR